MIYGPNDADLYRRAADSFRQRNRWQYPGVLKTTARWGCR